MALTLAQAELYTTNMVYRGIIEEFIRQSPVFPRLSFQDVVGNAYQYLRESTRSSAGFYDPLDTWTESTGTVAQVTVGLKILGGDADVDNFLTSTRSDRTDIESELIMEKVKSVKFTFLDAFYYGASATNQKAFDGLHALVQSAMTIHEASAATVAGGLNVSNLDALMDLIEDGPPDILVMPKAIRRLINAYIRANGLYEQNRDEWGNMVQMYQGVPIYVDDTLVTTEALSGSAYSAKTGGTTCGSIFAIRFGPKDVFGIQNSGSIQTKKIRDELDDKDAGRWRIKWYCGMGLGYTKSLGMIDGIDSTVAVAA